MTGEQIMAKVLVVDDEENLVATPKYNLAKEGYEVCTALDGTSALATASKEKPDLVILDIMLPGVSGFEVCRKLRRDTTVPILMLTAKDEEVDKVAGLELGADDYVTKPFSMRELMARVRAMLRRVDMLQEQAGEPIRPQNLELGPLALDVSSHEAYFKHRPISLKPKEFDLLAFLLRHPGQVFTRQQLLQQVWGYSYFGDERTVDVHIRWLREKIEEEPSHPTMIQTVRGVGYRLNAPFDK